MAWQNNECPFVGHHQSCSEVCARQFNNEELHAANMTPHMLLLAQIRATNIEAQIPLTSVPLIGSVVKVGLWLLSSQYRRAISDADCIRKQFLDSESFLLSARKKCLNRQDSEN